MESYALAAFRSRQAVLRFEEELRGRPDARGDNAARRFTGLRVIRAV